jgi:crotonobetainyl-CoA:carnitine CoA-transferase CaiB-like acyl-CoA transferase
MPHPLRFQHHHRCWARNLTPGCEDEPGALFAALNRNKDVVRIDITSAADRAGLLERLSTADVVVADWSANQDDPVQQLLAQISDDDKVILNLSWYGQHGSLSTKEGSELTIQAMTGYLRALGSLDGEPVRVGADIAESAAAGMGLLGALAALFHRGRTGEGQTVSVSRLAALMSLRSLQWAAISNPDEWLGPSYCLAETDPPRHGYRTKDTNIFVSMMNLRDNDMFVKMLEELEMLPDVA